MKDARSIAVALASLALSACPTPAKRGGGAAPPPPTAETSAPSRGDRVTLTEADLAPVHAYIAKRRWVLGDEAEVVASHEYFVQHVMVASKVGEVERSDTADATGARITLVNASGDTAISSVPRVMFGTGLTVMARRRLVLRLVRTTDAALPIRLSVTVSGDASTGSQEQVERRAETLTLEASLRLQDGAYRFAASGP